MEKVAGRNLQLIFTSLPFKFKSFFKTVSASVITSLIKLIYMVNALTMLLGDFQSKSLIARDNVCEDLEKREALGLEQGDIWL